MIVAIAVSKTKPIAIASRVVILLKRTGRIAAIHHPDGVKGNQLL